MDDPKIIWLLKKAIRTELKQQELYERLSILAETFNCKMLFEALVNEEQKHEVLLKTYISTGDIEIARKKINIYKTKFDLTSRIININYDSRELREGMILAAKNEQKQMMEYMKLWTWATKKQMDLLLRDVMLSLVREESNHRAAIEYEYTRLFGHRMNLEGIDVSRLRQKS